MSVGLPLGHLFGRLGCHYHGCCFGKHSEHAIAIGGRLPVQLLEAGGEVLVFAIVLLFFLRMSGDAQRRNRTLSAFELSAVPMLFLTLYSPMRFLTELIRGDDLRGFVVRIPWPALAQLLGFGEREPVFFSTSQLLSIVLLVVAAGYWVAHLLRRS
jgi:phosphatidylglycerol:prolipoprotein diacylglycerol transferase